MVCGETSDVPYVPPPGPCTQVMDRRSVPVISAGGDPGGEGVLVAGGCEERTSVTFCRWSLYVSPIALAAAGAARAALSRSTVRYATSSSTFTGSPPWAGPGRRATVTP